MGRSHHMRRVGVLVVGFGGLLCGSEARGGDMAPLPCIAYPEQRFLGVTESGFVGVGAGVAMSGDVAVTGTGSQVFVLQRVGSTWVQQQTVLPTDFPAFGYGLSVGLRQDVMVVGARYDDDNGTQSGSAYVLRFNGKEWAQEAKLVAFDGAADDEFGTSVSVWGDAAVIGAPGDDTTGIVDHGAAYVFRFNGDEWMLEQKLTPSDPATDDRFGQSLAMWDGEVVIGSAGDDVGAMTNAGSVTAFGFDGTAWVEQQTMVPLEHSAHDFFGASVAMEADQLVVGMPGDDPGGSAWVFEKGIGGWSQEAKLTAFEELLGGFGRSAAVSGDRIVIGAPETSMSGYHGTAHVFRKIGGSWTGNCNLHPVGPSDPILEGVGESVGISGEVAMVGAPGDHIWAGQSGSVYFFSAFADCNGNNVPDACDAPDCNGNHVPDGCEISSGASADCNGNGVPDECDSPFHYELDDGSAESALGYSCCGADIIDLIWLNQFDVAPGREVIDRIGIIWRSSMPIGAPVTLLVYGDPNGDGDPSDAVLLSTAQTRTRDYGFGWDPATTFAYEEIPATFVGSAGASFFIGAKTLVLPPAYPAAADLSGPGENRSWIAAALNEADIENLANNFVLPVEYDFALRAMSSDCNGNGVWDGCDISEGVSADGNGNGIPDECESASCVADIAPEGAPDGVVNVADLLAVIGAWGSTRGPADINGDGIVDVEDLLSVVGNWGPCE
ncbi:MAG: hypothetical protein L0219_18600 [Phycisphaerales bacterium]|nr:hypothetical protein [Phycisphaerales bacterium]